MTTVTVCVRLDGDRLIADRVDLESLTPKARALAEAIADSSGHQPIGVLCDTGKLKGDNPNFGAFRGPGPEFDAEAREPDLRMVTNWGCTSADSTTAEAWLEMNARSIPHTVTPIAGSQSLMRPRDRNVPSADAAREDRCLTRDQVLAHIRTAGMSMTAAGWSLLSTAGHLPAPRHRALDGCFLLWHVDDVDAYLNRDFERWPLTRVAEYLGYAGESATGSARKQLSRWGLLAVDRAPGRGGESRYAADQIQAAQAARPGRGRRAAPREADTGRYQ